MLISLPNWYGKLEEKIWRLIEQVATEQDIDLLLVGDSRSLKKAVESICNKLLNLQPYESPEFPKNPRIGKKAVT